MNESFSEGVRTPDRTNDDVIRAALQRQISLVRLKILRETDAEYRVQYGETEVLIKKGDESSFQTVGNGAGMSMQMERRQELSVKLDARISQDENAPPEFREVMMLHELREREYKNAGFKDSHDRALHDETLYVLKFFPPEIQAAYFKWAEKYRMDPAELKEREREQFLLDRGLIAKRIGNNNRFGFAESIDKFYATYDLFEDAFQLFRNRELRDQPTPHALARIREIYDDDDFRFSHHDYGDDPHPFLFPVDDDRYAGPDSIVKILAILNEDCVSGS